MVVASKRMDGKRHEGLAYEKYKKRSTDQAVQSIALDQYGLAMVLVP